MPEPDRSLVLGDCRLDVVKRILKGKEGASEVSPIATRFLQLLAERAGETVSRTEFVEQLWAGNHLVGGPALNRVASEARKAVAAATGLPLVETVHGRGYRLITTAEPVSAFTAPSLTPTRWSRGWSIFAAAIFTFVLAVGAVIWILDQVMGLVGMTQQN